MGLKKVVKSIFGINGVSHFEKTSIDEVARGYGYRNINDFVKSLGYDSPAQLVKYYNFTSVRDFFLGAGSEYRISHLRRISELNQDSELQNLTR